MSVAIITGAAGLIGAEASRYFASAGMDIVGIDNDMRAYFFGASASNASNREGLKGLKRYQHRDLDIRDREGLDTLFQEFGKSVELVIHTAAQPSHDWAAQEPLTDFTINANGTLNLLEMTRTYCPEAVFIFTSTNKVYGDTPNQLPLVEQETRWEVPPDHPYAQGIPETMSIDQSLHSLFGASKVAADVLVQEYGRYFGMKTGCFRGGCLTGPHHQGAQLHGFLAYLMKCGALGNPYTIMGYKGKQVRDNIHCSDLISAFAEFFKNPTCGEVYNMGGGRFSHCSMLEAVDMVQEITGREMRISYQDQHRTGDHIWYISDLRRFQTKYPQWTIRYDVRRILEEMYAFNREQWASEG